MGRQGAGVARAERPALTGTEHTRGAVDARRAVEAVWRIESARIVGALARRTADLALAEDAAQEALAQALQSGRRTGCRATRPPGC